MHSYIAYIDVKCIVVRAHVISTYATTCLTQVFVLFLGTFRPSINRKIQIGTPVAKKFSGTNYFGEVTQLLDRGRLHVLYDDGDGKCLVTLEC